MDPETQKRWNAWAKAIVWRELKSFSKLSAQALGEALKPAFKKRDDRIAELERRLADLETATTGDKGTEWPIPERKVA